MTISIAWVRRDKAATELVFASDSRLSGGGNIDQCQKVFSLPREDCCISFAGSTAIAYPFIHQLQNAITEYKKAFDRAVDITDLHRTIVALLNDFISAHDDMHSAFEEELLTTSFLFGGWSWKMNELRLSKLQYSKARRRYTHSPATVARILGLPRHEAINFGFVGDYRPDYFKRLTTLVRTQNNTPTTSFTNPFALNYEPLQLLAEMLRNEDYTNRRGPAGGLIGGAPQVVKVYPFMRTMHYAVEWDIGPKFVYALKGRIVRDFENFSNIGINPFTGVTAFPVKGPSDDFIAFDLARKERIAATKSLE